MKKIIIVAPHFPPSNLAAVHRSRLFAQHLPSFGWEPIIVTVHEKYYEEQLDYNLEKLLPPQLRVIKTKAIPTKPFRLIGDIGIRAFYQMYKAIISLIETEKIDFLYIPIPSHFAALLGRLVHRKTGIKYGIDYIDPWVHQWPGTEKKLSKHWWSMKLSEWLEPIAVKKVSLITGVAEGYYQGVIDRNSYLKQSTLFVSMPYGGEYLDHVRLKELQLKSYLFEKKENKIQLVYAGAMLPKAYKPLEQIFKAIAQDKSFFKNVELHFIGTGKLPNDNQSFNIKPLAEQYNLWQEIVFEYPARISYLDVLIHLDSAAGIFILGSTEPHYTPSKIYQGVLSEKPILAILHQASSACEIIKNANAGLVLSFNGEDEIEKIGNQFVKVFNDFISFYKTFDASNVIKTEFEKYSAKEVTRILAEKLDEIN